MTQLPGQNDRLAGRDTPAHPAFGATHELVLLFADLAHLVSIGDYGFGVSYFLSFFSDGVFFEVVEESDLLGDFVGFTATTEGLLEDFFVGLDAEDEEEVENALFFEFVVAEMDTL